MVFLRDQDTSEGLAIGGQEDPERLRMSDVAQEQSLVKQVAGRWQIPLLGLAVILLIAGVWQMRPKPKLPTFDESYEYALSLTEAGLYPEASKFAQKLLAEPERTPEQRHRLHFLLAEIIFAHESGNTVHAEENAERIILHSGKLSEVGEPCDAEMYRKRAIAFEWLKRPSNALAEYQKAVDKGIDNVWHIRKRMIEIKRTINAVTPEQLHAEYDEFLANPEVEDQLQYWAAEHKVELYGLAGEHAEAERFLAGREDKFGQSVWQKEYNYLRALAWYHLSRLDEAEQLLRALRDELSPADKLHVRSGWLLGRVIQAQRSPEPARSFFDDVIRNSDSGPYRTASILGRAETLAESERFDESIDAFHKVLQLTTEDVYGSLVSLIEVRKSTAAMFRTLQATGKLPEAMEYLRIAAKLVPPADDEEQAQYAEWMADLAFTLGERLAAQDNETETEASTGERARQYLIKAGQQYLRLASLKSLDGPISSNATWRAADAFDLAGDRERTAEVLEAFVLERPASTQAPKALLRLGQTYQAMGEYDKAIEKYEYNLGHYWRTLSANKSVVHLADCFIAKGQLDKAEKTLLRIVAPQPGEKIGPLEPVADEYRDALFRLGDLYSRSGEFEKAIARYEEALERYQKDPRTYRATYLLADAYRQSAVRIREDIKDPKNIADKDDLRLRHQKRLRRAKELYDKVVVDYRGRQGSSLGDLDRLYVKLSSFYRADVVFDLSYVAGVSDLAPYAEALELYDRAAWLYQSDPLAMAAYVQMITCHLRMGQADNARMMLQRAKWALKNISDEQFLNYAPEEDRKFWEDYLKWLEKTPTFVMAERSASS